MNVPSLPTTAARLDRIARIADEIGARSIALEAHQVAEKIAEHRFFVACVGQFKRGKSTLINALLGEPLLPAGIVPVTSVVTILRYGEQRRAWVHLRDRRIEEIPTSALVEFVAEERNPANCKGVEVVEAFVPSAWFADGMCLVDTPGVGSVFDWNADATRRFIPHVDAAIIVLGADPPLAADELHLVDSLTQNLDRLILVLNKADRLTDVEIDEGARFARRVLAERLHREIGPIYEVSASERLRSGPTRDWSLFERELGKLAHAGRDDLVHQAENRGAKRLAALLLHELAERRLALTQPIEESERRAASLRECLDQAERQIHQLGFTFQGEQSRLSADLEGRLSEYLNHTLPGAIEELRRGLASSRVAARDLRGRSFELARTIARRHVEPWRAAIEPLAQQLYLKIANRSIEQVNQFVREVARHAGAAAAAPQLLALETTFRARSQLYHTEMMGLTGSSLLGLLLGLVRSEAGRHRAAMQSGSTYLERLIRSNCTRVIGDVVDRISESRRTLESEIRLRLRDVVLAAERALDHARSCLAQGSDLLAAELEQISRLTLELCAVARAAGPSLGPRDP